MAAGFAASLVLWPFSLPAQPAADEMATLTIVVERVSKRGGDVRVALYDGANWGGTQGKDSTGAIVPAVAGRTIVVLKNIPPGMYAVKLFQDENRNGEMDFDWFGIPKERFGFSRDAKPKLEQPSFDSAKIELRPGANSATVNLRWLF